jgi:hypothetical protein
MGQHMELPSSLHTALSQHLSGLANLDTQILLSETCFVVLGGVKPRAPTSYLEILVCSSPQFPGGQWVGLKFPTL